MKRLGIVVGGGPAPGINGVIAAATRRAAVLGIPCIGIRDGFKWLSRGIGDRTDELRPTRVLRTHFSGGSILGTARENPTKSPELLSTTIETLHRLEISHLITIGGDDTAFTASRIQEESRGKIAVVHVPKTIDNDLDLPEGVPTFGFETARELGVRLVRNLLLDAETTGRWYLVIAMGRKAGHLALGIGKAANCPLTLIPELFPDGAIPLSELTRKVAGTILASAGALRNHGVVVLAEGLIERVPEKDLDGLKDVERDDHGNIRYSELNFGGVLKRALETLFKELKFKTTVVAKDIGYELRCAEPTAFDIEYTHDLGSAAVNLLVDGKGGALVSIQNSRVVPIPFSSLMDPKTGKSRVRMVNPSSERVISAIQSMTTLKKSAVTETATALSLSEDRLRPLSE